MWPVMILNRETSNMCSNVYCNFIRVVKVNPEAKSITGWPELALEAKHIIA